ncbi:unnamed protein product [Cylindrotheca closterium]|uniref:Uncharacterized protein n=1 Tax=Cylindrotheca closterium TaxID=2856 RepID=A0AAD2FFM2_9STRA|nr:unnamed protein product [Cylindrotheca closterium]
MAIINTKKCKSINATTPEVKENPNKYIPESLLIKKEADTEDNQEELGRELRYKLDILATPVLNSSRKSDKPGQRTLSKDNVDSLCDEFEKLMTTKTTSSSTTSETESESESSDIEDDEKEPTSQELEDTGRVDGTAFNYRTFKSYKVKRSARIAKKY